MSRFSLVSLDFAGGKVQGTSGEGKESPAFQLYHGHCGVVRGVVCGKEEEGGRGEREEGEERGSVCAVEFEPKT